jgi:hypothetical protein
MLWIELTNVSEMKPVSDYDYMVKVTTLQGGVRLLSVGRIKNHKRSDGWKALVQQLLNEAETIDNVDKLIEQLRNKKPE